MLRSIAAVALIAMVPLASAQAAASPARREPLVQARTNSAAQIDCNGADVCGLVVIETGLGQGCASLYCLKSLSPLPL